MKSRNSFIVGLMSVGFALIAFVCSTDSYAGARIGSCISDCIPKKCSDCLTGNSQGYQLTGTDELPWSVAETSTEIQLDDSEPQVSNTFDSEPQVSDNSDSEPHVTSNAASALSAVASCHQQASTQPLSAGARLSKSQKLDLLYRSRAADPMPAPIQSRRSESQPTAAAADPTDAADAEYFEKLAQSAE